MIKRLKQGALFGAALAVSTLGLGGAAGATMNGGGHGAAVITNSQPYDGRQIQYEAYLGSLNNSGSTGTVYVTAEGNQAHVKIVSSGLSPNLPHAQHIHIGAAGVCPDITADMDGDGLINTVEGAPFYGGVGVSLTTEGDTSPDSTVAVDRMPVAGADGTVVYERTVPIPEGMNPADLENGVIVQHGISELFDDPTAYDGAPRSSLAETLPLEATIPTNCGPLNEVASAEMPTKASEITAAVHEFHDSIHAVRDDSFVQLSAEGMAHVSEFGSTFDAATAAFEQEVQHIEATAADHNQYVDSLNRAKANYLNELDMAKNVLAANLSNLGHDANVAKDQFMNGFNHHRDYLSNHVEMIKNSH